MLTDGYAQLVELPQNEALIDLYEPSESQWFLPAVAFILNDAIAVGRPGALVAMGALLETANMDFYGRSAVNTAIRAWREIARAPVQESATPELWI
jgi:hypothetical protein